MTPRQTVAPVLASVVPAGPAGAAVGVPVGMAVHAAVVPAMGRSAGLRLPQSVLSVHDTDAGCLAHTVGLLSRTGSRTPGIVRFVTCSRGFAPTLFAGVPAGRERVAAQTTQGGL